MQADGRFFLTNAASFSGNTPPGPDTFLMRQTRIRLDGYFFKDVNYRIMADFANSNLLPDAYIDYTYHPSASLLVGKFKPAVSLERLQTDAYTVFLERSFASNLAPNRDVGIELHGGFSKPGYKAEKVAGAIDAKNAFTYQVGVTNGGGDNGNLTTAGADKDSNKELVGRVFAHPFQHTGYSWLEGFGLGVAGSFSNPSQQALNTQVTPLGQTQFLDYTKLNTVTKTTGTVTANGFASRIYPQAYWYSGPFGLMGEYVTSSQHLAAGGVNNNLKQTNTAFQAQASYVVTGEDNTFGGVKPMRNFDPLKGSWGALQLAARYSELDVDNSTFKILDPSKSASKARAFTVGANWFLNRNALIRTDYEFVSFDGGAGTNLAGRITNRPNEQVFSTRFQLYF